MKMKRLVSAIAALAMSVSAFAGMASAEEEAELTFKPLMTYVDYDNADAAMGYVTTANTGYHSGSGLGFKNTGWGCNWTTYLKLDVTSVIGTITAATLTLESSGSTDSKRTAGVGLAEVSYNDWDNTLTYTTAVANGMNTPTSNIIGQQWTTSMSATTFNTLTYDVTDLVKNDADGIITVALYETNAGGCYIQNPVLTIESIAKTVDYTINYTVDGKTLFSDTGTGGVGGAIYAENSFTLNSVKYLAVDGVATSMILADGENVLNVPIGKAVDYTINYILNNKTLKTVTDTKAAGSVINADETVVVNGTKYCIADNTETSMTLVDGENVLNVELREANKYKVTVVAVGDIEKTVSTVTGIVENADVTYYFPRYISDGTTLYSTAAQNGGYCGTVSNITEDKFIEIAYSKVADKEIVYFSEAEDIPGATERTMMYCSNGRGGTLSSAKTITTLPAGKYIITAGAYGANLNITVIAGDNRFTTTTGAEHSETTSEEFILTEDTSVELSENGTVSRMLDYIIIEKTGDVDSADANGEIAVEVSDAQTNYISDTNKATGFTATFTNVGNSMHLVQNVTWTITPENAEGVEIPCELPTIMTLRSGASAVVGIVLDGLYDENAEASAKIG